ncbi:MAG TPA: DEAD/DEAH box helicase, partial [Myxococcota bacterium]|nr:DEAD/DEAH box helicase [Myxococcota bacterium]
MNFSSLGLLPALTQVCTELGFTEATPIQELALPVLLRGADLVGQARTGSGKTLAFALPLLQNLDLSSRSPQALILGPTRELVAQVTREIRKVGRSLPGLRVLPLAGGEPIFGQSRALDEGAHILVATPGRLLDHLDRNNVPLRLLKVLVLDEADRMLELGFAEDLRKILEQLPTPRQTALFSATFPPDIER